MDNRVDLVKAINVNKAEGDVLRSRLKQMDNKTIKMEQQVLLDRIKVLWDNIKAEDRSGFVEVLAKELNTPVSTLRTNWFSRWDIPVRFKVRETVIKYMENYIANKNNALI